MPFSTLSATDGLYSGWSALLGANQPVLLPQELAHVTAAVFTSEHCFRIGGTTIALTAQHVLLLLLAIASRRLIGSCCCRESACDV